MKAQYFTQITMKHNFQRFYCLFLKGRIMAYDINIIHLFQASKPIRFNTPFTPINENRVKAEHSIFDLITFSPPNSSSCQAPPPQVKNECLFYRPTPISTFPLVASSDFYENCYEVAAYRHWPSKPHTARTRQYLRSCLCALEQVVLAA